MEVDTDSTRTVIRPDISHQPASTRSPRSVVATEAIKNLALCLWEIKKKQQSLEHERDSLVQQLNLAYLQGQMHQFLNDGQDEKGYLINPELTLVRRTGQKQWNYSLSCHEMACKLKEYQRHEQQNGVASYTQGSAFWDIRMDTVNLAM
ncbi:hypothetical protein [Synechococcus sp. LA31]|uniref:hypothetical protein n=1 Tax=Synechococcus sp. LA31 TaxID=2741953 RepID=UPI001BDD7D39|nr:hypothetical protein [Synechococcus sp. LA31]QVV67436.1 hypothetical protein KJJ24_13640 [Synechococcus sp. LA31]